MSFFVKSLLGVWALLCGFHAAAQVNSPDLRCLKVINGGDVGLQWQIPPDPNGQYVSYVIFSSLLKSGPFSPIDSITNYSVNTYTHVGAGANIQSRYYYMLCRYNQGSLKTSAPKDTLRSIWLGLISIGGAKTLKLQYNDLKTPHLSSTGSFTISKEYPIGTWKTLRVTDSDTYGDTISVCTASINYQITCIDNSGCISQSNTNGGLYFDTKSPEEPVVDSISVLPNGQTVIAWQVPIDKDIVKYEIQLRTSAGTNTVVDEVLGRNNTIYTFTNTMANGQSTAIYVAAIDSCKRGSTLNYSIASMYLKTVYHSCDFRTELSWNPYVGLYSGVKAYDVYYSDDNSSFRKLTTTTLTAFTHTGVSAGKQVTYFVRVINNAKTITASSNRAKFLAYLVNTPTYLYLPSVTVKDNTTVEVKILIDTSKNSNGIDLMRSTNGQSFTPIAFVPYGGSPNLLYEDQHVETDKRSYYYKAVLRDSCGNSRLESNTCKTMWLQVDDDRDNIYTKHLHWNAYEGFAGATKFFRIYRVVNDAPETTPIATTNSLVTKYDDNIEPLSNRGAKISYYVEAIENSLGNPYGITDKSRSNLSEVYMEGGLFIPNAFAPNGANSKWLPITVYVDKHEYLLRIFDRWGQQIFQTNSDSEAWDGGNYPGDVYVYIISYQNARGEYKEAKGTLLLIR